jgi:hypothetical protein
MLNISANDNSEDRTSSEEGAFVIETADTAAGVIVRQGNGYRFFAADRQFNLLDGSVFKSPKAAQQAADLMRRAAARDLAAARRFGNGQNRDGRPAEPRRDRA